jgi:REP element-mobilizing transposase RayT
MVRAYHVIFGMYGFWLPNDPRGSWSDYVWSWELLRFGPATKTMETRSLAYQQHDRWLRLKAKEALKYPPVILNGIQARTVGEGFAEYLRRSKIDVWACAILPDHAHLVVGRFRLKIESVVNQLKGAATRALVEKNLHPLGHIRLPNGRPPKCFARGLWAPFLETDDEIVRSIGYVDGNPEKEGKPRQNWSFVKPYDPRR